MNITKHEKALKLVEITERKLAHMYDKHALNICHQFDNVDLKTAANKWYDEAPQMLIDEWSRGATALSHALKLSNIYGSKTVAKRLMPSTKRYIESCSRTMKC